MNSEKKEIIYICNNNPIVEEEIDLKELFSTIWNYRKFILSFTFVISFITLIYILSLKPIYEIKATVKIGYILTDIDSKIDLLDFDNTIIFLKNNYENIEKKTPPFISINTKKIPKNMFELTIDDYSNKQAINRLNSILEILHKKEKEKITLFEKKIKTNINFLTKQKNELIQNIKNLKKNIHSIKDANILNIVYSQLNNYQTKLTNITKKIILEKQKLSKDNIYQTNIVGNIIKKDHPVKPKKKLILIITFITSFILSIFIVFFIEFIKGIRRK